MPETCTITGCTAATGGKDARYCPRHRSERRGQKPRRWVPTEAIDTLIAEAWRDPVLHGKAAALWVAEHMPPSGRWPAWLIRRRARDLGLARRVKPEPAWSAQEIAVLEQNAWLTPARIRQKLLRQCGTKRSPAGIILKRKRLGLLAGRAADSGYSCSALAGLLGIGHHKVERWVRRGVLKAERRGREALGSAVYAVSDPANMWWIDRESVRDFILAYPDEIDLCRIPDRGWLFELLAKKTKRRTTGPPTEGDQKDETGHDTQ